MAAVYETLSSGVRFLSTGIGALGVAPVDGAAAGVAGAAIAGGASDVSGCFSVSTVATRGAVESRAPGTVWGVEAVETGGSPFLTDSGPQAPTRRTANGATARRIKMRDVERSMMREIYRAVRTLKLIVRSRVEWQVAGATDKFAAAVGGTMRTLATILTLASGAAAATVGCSQGAAREESRVAQSGATAGASWDSTAWRAPDVAKLPNDSLSAAIKRGRALILATAESLPRFVGGNLNCTSCHLDEGRRGTSAPLTGVFGRYPRYIERSGAVVSMQERVNYCMTRSLAGTRLPNDSREMLDMLAYLAFLGRGVPMGAHLPQEGMPALPKDVGDSTRGAEVYRAACVRCHGADGSGMQKVPAVWGPKSFSIGASMARQERAASFIRHNMPFDKPGTLTDRQAYDVAAYVTSQPRPDMPEKARDWPFGGAPADVPYETPGHAAYRPPRLLPRANRADGYVPPPAKAATGLR
jgi:thiosulfate dehydrogenase